MNKNQRRYLMEEVRKIYNDKINQINLKYPSIYQSDMIKNYMKANRLKLRFKSDEDIIDFIYDTIVNDNYKRLNEILGNKKMRYYSFVYENIIEDYIWFDLTEINNKISEVNEKKENIRKELKNKLNYINDKIMFDTSVNKFIKNTVNENDYMDKSIEEYIKELEDFEV